MADSQAIALDSADLPRIESCIIRLCDDDHLLLDTVGVADGLMLGANFSNDLHP